MKKIAIVAALVLISGAIALGNQFEAMGLKFIAPSVNDKANVYSPEVGEIVYDSSDSKFYGRTHGSQWVDMTGASSSQVPTGTILPFAGTTTPVGYALADGSAVSRTSGTYADLFAVIGTTFGAGDGSTTYNLPDLRGVFVRGAGSQTINSISYSGTLGTRQNDQTQGHKHSITDPGHTHGTPLGSTVVGGTGPAPVISAAASNGTYSVSTNQTTGITVQNPTTDGTNGTPRTGSETRPANISLNYIIKL